MNAQLAFVDTETTGLDPVRHQVWEVGLILRWENGDELERSWQLPVDLARADPMGLEVGRFHDRRLPAGQWTGLRAFAHEFAILTLGARLVGAVISFDEERLRRLLRANGECPMWHYHLVDVEALAAGWLAGRYEDAAFATPLSATPSGRRPSTTP
ncbi:MAG TPA: hypothetical protein VGR26_14825 [Acidimicrobiales bacterium]|nr:hypothetical protein [Acidimicrobiales bacterium]